MNNIDINGRQITVTFDHMSDAVSDAEYKELENKCKLIAAAPEMLEALEALYEEMINPEDNYPMDILKIKALIKKAKGD